MVRPRMVGKVGFGAGRAIPGATAEWPRRVECGRLGDLNRPGLLRYRRPKTTVPGWRERLLCCKCGSREVDIVVTGTERAAGLFGRSPIVHWRYRFTGGGKRIRTRSPTVVFAVGPAERETISIGAAENPTLSSEARPTVRIRFPPAVSPYLQWTAGLRAKSRALSRRPAHGWGRETERADHKPALSGVFSLTGIDAVPPWGSADHMQRRAGRGANRGWSISSFLD